MSDNSQPVMLYVALASNGGGWRKIECAGTHSAHGLLQSYKKEGITHWATCEKSRADAGITPPPGVEIHIVDQLLTMPTKAQFVAQLCETFPRVVTMLKFARLSLPEVCRQCAIDAFMDNLSGPVCDMLRHQLQSLEKTGMFDFARG